VEQRVRGNRAKRMHVPVSSCNSAVIADADSGTASIAEGRWGFSLCILCRHATIDLFNRRWPVLDNMNAWPPLRGGFVYRQAMREK
jgi:hypothetical protein